MKRGVPQKISAGFLQALRRVPRSAVDDLITTLFPADCRLCDVPLLRTSSLPVCELCLRALRPQAETHPGRLCGICGEALGFESERFLAGRGPAEQICTPCRLVPPAFARAVAFGVYGGELRAMIGLLKFEGLRSAAEPLGRLLANAIAELAPGVNLPAPCLDPAVEILVTAVPLFRGKTRERGFNQAELLTSRALDQLRRTHPSLHLRAAHGILSRVKQTESQFGLNPRQRRENLRGAFSAPDPGLVAGRDVLLVDDIYTTGATARACASVLSRAGARQIFVVTLARAQTETVALWEPAFQAVEPRGINDVATALNRRA